MVRAADELRAGVAGLLAVGQEWWPSRRRKAALRETHPIFAHFLVIPTQDQTGTAPFRRSGRIHPVAADVCHVSWSLAMLGMT
jgi:hypothetical protein